MGYITLKMLFPKPFRRTTDVNGTFGSFPNCDQFDEQLDIMKAGDLAN